MITITRCLAQQVRAVFRRALNITPRGLSYPLLFEAGQHGLRIRSRSPDAAVEYLIPGDRPEDRITAPFELLAECEGRNDAPVSIEAFKDGHVVAGWRDRQVPQMVRYDAVQNAQSDEHPALPETLAENPPGLIAALNDAMATTEPMPIRFATNCVQLHGKSGSIAATDGRQLLTQTDFKFPWGGDVLVPRTTVFGCRELQHDQPVSIGLAGDWVTLKTGPWTLQLAINKDGRFPQVERQVPKPSDATAQLQIDGADAEFLAQSLPRLPGDEACSWPITVELNGSVAIRARASAEQQPTELILSRSTLSGEPIRINTNRKFLARALDLGFREVLFYSPETPVLCQDAQRSFLWAILDPESAIAANKDAVRLVSDQSEPETPAAKPKSKRRTPTVSEITNRTATSTTTTTPQNGEQAKTTNGQPRKSRTRKSRNAETMGLIEQAEIVRTALREALSKTTELVKGLKCRRRQSRALESTIASLRDLKGIGV